MQRNRSLQNYLQKQFDINYFARKIFIKNFKEGYEKIKLREYVLIQQRQKYKNSTIELLDEGKLDQIILASTFVIETQQQNAMVYIYNGNIDDTFQIYDEAIKDYTRAISIDLKYVDAYFNRGRIYDILQNHEEAIKDYNSPKLYFET